MKLILIGLKLFISPNLAVMLSPLLSLVGKIPQVCRADWSVLQVLQPGRGQTGLCLSEIITTHSSLCAIYTPHLTAQFNRVISEPISLLISYKTSDKP